MLEAFVKELHVGDLLSREGIRHTWKRIYTLRDLHHAGLRGSHVHISGESNFRSIHGFTLLADLFIILLHPCETPLDLRFVPSHFTSSQPSFFALLHSVFLRKLKTYLFHFLSLLSLSTFTSLDGYLGV